MALFRSRASIRNRTLPRNLRILLYLQAVQSEKDMTASEDPDLIDFINQGDKLLTEMMEEGRRLSRLLDLLETKEE